MKKVDKKHVLRKIKEEGYWEGWISPSNFYPNPGHPFNMALRAKFDKMHLVKEKPTSIDTPMELFLNEFEYYNCTEETGTEITYYEEEEE